MTIRVKSTDVVSPPVIQKPTLARSATPTFIMSTMKPSLIDDEPLQFRVQVFEDEQMQDMISEVSSADNPESFEFSLDKGASWSPFPEGGLGDAEWGAMLRCKVSIGPRNQVWVRTGTGLKFSESISGFVYDLLLQPLEGVTVYAIDKLGGGPIVSTQSKDDGAYTLSVDPGAYVVVAEKSGYITEIQENIVVNECEKVVDANFALEQIV